MFDSNLLDDYDNLASLCLEGWTTETTYETFRLYGWKCVEIVVYCNDITKVTARVQRYYESFGKYPEIPKVIEALAGWLISFLGLRPMGLGKFHI